MHEALCIYVYEQEKIVMKKKSSLKKLVVARDRIEIEYRIEKMIGCHFFRKFENFLFSVQFGSKKLDLFSIKHKGIQLPTHTRMTSLTIAGKLRQKENVA